MSSYSVPIVEPRDEAAVSVCSIEYNKHSKSLKSGYDGGLAYLAAIKRQSFMELFPGWLVEALERDLIGHKTTIGQVEYYQDGTIAFRECEDVAE